MSPLPNPGMDFTAFDTLPAASLDDLVENIESLADGSGISADVFELDSASTATGQSFPSTGPTDATSMSITFTTSASCTKIRVRAEATISSDTAAATNTLYITNASNTVQVKRDIITGQANVNALQFISVTTPVLTVTPNTSYTYKLRVGNSAGTTVLNQGNNASSPTCLWVERV